LFAAASMEEVTAKLLLDRLTAAERELAELKQHVAALEAQPAIRYAGVWRPDQKYERGVACTHDGGLWIAEHATDQRPGNGATSWRLAVKRGHANGDVPPPARFPTRPRSNGFGR
jgi:hypothetical protein